MDTIPAVLHFTLLVCKAFTITIFVSITQTLAHMYTNHAGVRLPGYILVFIDMEIAGAAIMAQLTLVSQSVAKANEAPLVLLKNMTTFFSNFCQCVQFSVRLWWPQATNGLP